MSMGRPVGDARAIRSHFAAELEARLNVRCAVVAGRDHVCVQINEAGHARTLPARQRVIAANSRDASDGASTQ
jgi:hypothetical protein